ncbi:ACP S-malonyltransferase [Porticoccaceae bacterium]|jgi:[acyl-carrier-protein] S-malonyltransferase|nr:ACP S-malonyltransferase [Porticoccaceae bacterium]MDC1477298.1 ACP S-malonyltransferase [Porticoccaceae bacterium]CAI8361081.1 MAG: Malonyl CoA-acyl carrier protein transacylase [SAR92 bacterium MED-G29]|tara:strand:+ start:8062 stop:9000 length:939 start_codon:yes stop_codon:yes gene_type:complete
MSKSNLAFVFPGQGSQKIGMLAELAADNPTVEATFAEASEALGYDLWDMIQNGDQEDINLTERTQPMLLASSVAIWRLWGEKGGPMPSQFAGHSLGEWSALVCAGSLDFADAVKIVRSRGAYMQQAVPVGEGAMAAILGIADDIIIAACDSARESGVVNAVNFNAPGQVVIAGSTAGVDRAITICKEAGAKRAMALPVSAPFHTSLMRPAAEQLAELVQATSFVSPTIPVIHNVTAQTEADPKIIKSLMLEQIYKPVMWVDCILALKAAGAEQFVECGPGRVLNGLTKRIDRDLTSFSSDDAASLDNALTSI